MDERGGTHLLELFDDFFIFIQIWLVGCIHTCVVNMRNSS